MQVLQTECSVLRDSLSEFTRWVRQKIQLVEEDMDIFKVVYSLHGSLSQVCVIAGVLLVIAIIYNNYVAPVVYEFILLSVQSCGYSRSVLGTSHFTFFCIGIRNAEPSSGQADRSRAESATFGGH